MLLHFLTVVEAEITSPVCFLWVQTNMNHAMQFYCFTTLCLLFFLECFPVSSLHIYFSFTAVVVKSHKSCPTLCDPMVWSMPGFPVLHHLQEFTQTLSTESVISSNYIILCHPLLFVSSIFPSIRVFSNESALHIRWPEYWSFSFSISPSNEYSGLISFTIDWFYHLAVQETLKSLLQHHSLKASILPPFSVFTVQLS